MMAVTPLLGRELSWDEAERLSGFVEGRPTWPYRTFLSLSQMGLTVHTIQSLEPTEMAVNPAAEIARVFRDDKAVSKLVDTFEASLESDRIRACLADPTITFEVRAPTTQDIERGLAAGALVMVFLDYAVLYSTKEYEGHTVLATTVDASHVEVFDPGPPGHAGRPVPRELMERAMHSPSDDCGAVIWLKAHDLP